MAAWDAGQPHHEQAQPGALYPGGISYWSPARTDVMRWVLKPSQCIRPM
ncbi:MAG: hypothetical protein JWQ95_2726 [Sphaerisporangium sp.]|nr:hypothetical protein [Sphaerisporangium sp.]